VPADFIVVEIGGSENSLIILGRPFLSTAKAIIYVDNAKICFTIKGRRDSPSRTKYYKLLPIRKQHTSMMTRQQRRRHLEGRT
jgi:hypothetical protein